MLKRRSYDVKWGLKGPAQAPDFPVKDLHVQFFLSKEMKQQPLAEQLLFWPDVSSVFPQTVLLSLSDVFCDGRPLTSDQVYPFHLKQIDLRERNGEVTLVSWNLVYGRATERFIDPQAVVLRLLDSLDSRLHPQLGWAPAG